MLGTNSAEPVTRDTTLFGSLASGRKKKLSQNPNWNEQVESIDYAGNERQWFWLVFLCLSTHGILDSFTVYGTQLMWPITEYPFAVSNLFIIDSLYTLPLLFAFIVIFLPLFKLVIFSKINE